MSGVLLLSLSLILVTLTVTFASDPKKTSPAVGASLSELKLFDLDGRRHDLREVRAKCVVVVLWAFWCDTWKKALPSLVELASERRALDFEVWTVSVDGRWSEQIRPLLAASHVEFPVLVDDGKWTRRLGLRRVPTVLVLNPQRRVVWSHEGYPGNDALMRAIRKVGNQAK